MKIKILYSIIVSTCVILPIRAQLVSSEQAQDMAIQFFRAQNCDFMEDSFAKQSSLQILSLGRRDTTMYAISSQANWVLIAGDLRVTPILAYSDENGGAFPSGEDMPPAMAELIDWYDSQIAYIRDNAYVRNINTSWSDTRNNEASLSRSVIVGPLLYRDGYRNRWGQDGYNGNASDSTKFYNKFCPKSYMSGDSCLTVAGCVAVATSQVMWYWQWPHSAILENNNLRCYEWDLMPPRITDASSIEQANMIATLLHDVGVSVDMSYGCSASAANPLNIVTSLTTTYHFFSDTLRHRDYVSNTDWINMLKYELDANRPILYGGSGHRFVLDGYNSSNEFHVNLGWKGAGNGYYLLDNIQYGGNILTSNQTAILNIQPDYPSCFPMEIQWGDVHENPFEVYGGTNLQTSNMTIYNGEKIVIYAGNEIKIQPPFSILNGANVHLAIKDMHCNLADLDNSSGLLIPDSDSIDVDMPDSQNLPARLMKTITSDFALVKPNPADDLISIQAEQTIKSISIFDYSGHCVLQTTSPGTTTAEITIGHLPAGMYILRVYTIDGHMSQCKFVHK